MDISGARKKMKLNRGKYQQLTGDSSLDEQTLHGIQTGILTLQAVYMCAQSYISDLLSKHIYLIMSSFLISF